MKRINKYIVMSALAFTIFTSSLSVDATNLVDTRVELSIEVGKSNGIEYRTIKDLALKEGNEESYKSLKTVKKGSFVKHLGTTKNDWFKLENDGTIGYIHRSQVTSQANYDRNYAGTKVEGPSSDIEVGKANGVEYRTIKDLALREGNADSYKSLKTMPKGSYVKHLGTTKNDWFKLENDGTIGYIHRSQVTSQANYDANYDDLVIEDFIGSEDNTIPSNLIDLKAQMKKELEAFEANIKIPYEGIVSSDEVRSLIRDIYSDGSYIGGAIKTITPRVNRIGNDSEVILSAQYYNTKEEEKHMDSEINRIIRNIIKPNMSQFQKVKAVHDYIVNNTTYSTSTNKTPHSAYAALIENKAVCQGYALLTYRFLDALDIENYYIIGDTLGRNGWGLHAWNLVKMDGNYYHLDTTKNDPVVADGNHILSYRYFLLSDKKISETHRMQNDIFPKATDNKYEALSNAYNPYEYKNKLYFGNKNDGDKLYSISLDNFKMEKLSENRAPYLVVDRDRIYFSNFSSGGHIYSSALNGKDVSQVNNIYSTHLKLNGSYIEFLNKTTNKLDKLKI